MKFWVLGAERTTHPDGVEEVKEEEGQGGTGHLRREATGAFSRETDKAEIISSHS